MSFLVLVIGFKGKEKTVLFTGAFYQLIYGLKKSYHFDSANYKNTAFKQTRLLILVNTYYLGGGRRR